MALFLLSGFFVGVLAPTVSVYALPRPTADNPHVKDDAAARNKPMKQNYAGGMGSLVADEKAAVDARPASGQLVSGVTGSVAQVGEALRGVDQKAKITPHELLDKRTANSSVTVNADGTMTEKQYFGPRYFKSDNKWQNIDTSLLEDKNAGDSSNILGKALGNVQSWVSSETTYKVKANEWQARFAPSDAKQGILRVGKGNDQVSFVAVDAKKGVSPVITTNNDGYQVVHYYDIWPGVNVEYIVESEAVKENIILKDRNAANQVAFKVAGAGFKEKTEKQKVGNYEVTTKAFVLKGAANDEFSIAPANLILNNYGFVSDQSILKQSFEGDEVKLTVDKNYLQNLPDKAFPAVIDPSTFYGTFGTRAGGNYVSFKSDGFICQSDVCNPYAGSLYDSNNVLRYWRSAVYAPYSQLNDPNKTISNATLHLKQRSNESFWTGTFDPHTYYVGHAACLNSFNCLDGGAFNDAGTVGSSGDIDVTNIYQSRINQGDFGAWLMLGSEDGTSNSFKNFDPGTGPYDSGTYVSFTYNGPPAAPSIQSPTANQVYVDPQPSFNVGYATNPNGSTPLQYQMRVSSAPSGAGFLIASPVLSSTQWTMPDNILQDGSTYYIQARSYDPISTLKSDWGASIPFRIDMRTGNDSTQTYSSMGPVNVNLATGNLSTGVTSHGSAALGGNLGVSLSYNTPLKSRTGLVGEYWKVAANYAGGVPTVTPDLTRVDQNVDFDWGLDSPSAGALNNDWYFAHWTGYFVAPTTGTYQFGGKNDDLLVVKVNNQQMYNNGGCYTGICYDSSSISLQEGQVVPISIEYEEATGPAYAHVYVKGPVDEKALPSDWLQTGVRPIDNKKHGLTGSYFARLDGTNTFSAGNYKFMERVDPYLSFNWGASAPVPGGPNDFLVRWTGYITVPTTGSYTFGSRSDDGSKITIGGSSTALNDWTDHSVPASPTWGTPVTIAANTPTQITIEYYDAGDVASSEFWVKNTAAGIADQIIPNNWLSTRAEVLPDGWDLGVDGSGTANYNHLVANQDSAVLTDSKGSAHEYSWTGSGYKPPVNEDGYLARNTDGTFTLQDADGQTYIFAADGTLTSVTSSGDDRNPAALQYEYQSLNGGPTHLYKIKDGIDTSRNVTLYYSGQSQCGSAPSGFDANAPAGMLCAAQTNDGRTTYFYYTQGQLTRVSTPGNAMTDYQYEAVTTASSTTIGYRMASVRDALANDVVAAGGRTNDDTVKTQFDYDNLGRVTDVKQPAATSGASRIEHTIEYLPSAKPYVDENGSPIPGYAGMTKLHVVGATEPNGYMQRVKYDNLFRTIENTNNAGLSTVTEWDANKDMIYSTTDATGLKSTTVYNDDDRPISSYGPAPKSWFTSGTPNNQVPLSMYAGQVPRADAAYDEGIVGPAVGWFDYTKLAGNADGALTGAPKLHATGINTSTPGVLSNTFTSPPITASSGAQGIGFSAAGELRLPNGTYTISADTSDGIRAQVDDQNVLNNWEDAAYRTVTGTSFTVNDSTPKRVKIEGYRRTGSTGTLNIKITQNGGFAATTNWVSYLKPGYGLTTSAKVYDSTIGNSTSTTNYGNTPELGLPQSVTADPSGLNLTSSSNYEQQGASGSYLRQTSNSRPGNATNNPAASYTYYSATDTRDNPCTTAAESYKQAGMLKLVTDASSDGGVTPGRKTETIYDDAGRIVATRNNSDDWGCITYDSRSRVTQTVVPAVGSEAARTITNNYAVYGDPTFTSTEDSGGVNLTQVDLLGRTTYYHDAQWNETWMGYDNLGRLLWRGSGTGDESFVYDNYGRLTQQKLDNTTYAVVNYDQYGRTQSVEYPNGGGQKMIVSRDALGRVTGQDYYSGGSQTPGGNLLANPSFEQASSNPDVPQNWRGNAWGTNTPVYTYLNEGYTGSHSVKTELTSYTDGDAKWQSDQVAVAPSTTYDFKDYYKSNVTTEVLVESQHQDNSFSYEWLGFVNSSNDWKQTDFNFTTSSTTTKVTVLHIIKSVGYLTVDDSELSAVSSSSQTIMASDAVTRSQTGRIVSGTENGQSKSYTYDSVGRLTNATIGSNTYSYGFGAQSGSCGTGTNANSGKDSNRTSQTINGATTSYCYDYADRLTTSSDPLANAAQYNAHGDLTLLGSGATPLRLLYDSSDRNRGLEQYDSSGNGTASYYNRDVLGRVIFRENDIITNLNWTTNDAKWYGYNGNGSAPNFVRDANWNVVEKYLSLPGGVMVTIRPTQTGNAAKVYSLPNLHGDTMATTNASGTLTGTYQYDPFGNKTSSTLPDNTSANSTLGWAGLHGKVTETALALTPVQMGARVYLPTLGRFAQIDPIPGGNINDYVYAVDPINSNDFSGKFLLQGGGASASTLQNTVSVNYFQVTAPAPYFQPAIGHTGVQNVAPATISVVPSVPGPIVPKYDNSTKMPVATVNAIGYLTNAKKQSDASLYNGSGGRENFNFVGAIGGAIAGYRLGGAVGFYAGCAITGIPTLGAGCLVGAAPGFTIGSIAGGVAGFFYEGLGYDKDNLSDGLPDDYYLPRP